MIATDPLRLAGATLARRYAIDNLVRVEESVVVYRATDLRSNRSVGVKVLAGAASLPEAKRSALVERLARDRATLAGLAQIIPAAYPLRDTGSVGTPQGAVPFVVLDWPHGVTLQQVMQPENGSRSSQSLPESIDDVVEMLEPIAVALAIAHENGVLHGGITADRVLFRDGRASDGRDARRTALLDFGVARALAAIDDGRDVAAADDVRALATLVSQVMARSCGADARPGDARTPRARGVVVSDDVQAVFVRALSAHTYGSVGDLWSALRRAMGLATLRSLEATIPPESRSGGSDAPSRSLRPFARSSAPAAGRVGREPIVYAVSAFALLALGGLTLMRTWSTPVAAPTCTAGMLRRGGTTVRIGQAGDSDEPLHDVTLRPFCIDEGAVTTSAYAVCSEHGDCQAPSLTNEWDGIGPDDHEVLDVFCTARDPKGQAARPVNCITWEMARAFCAHSRPGGRLPTEAEWELASSTTAASVAEWVSDWRAPIEGGKSVDPSGPATGDERVVRGAHAMGAAPTRFGATPATRSHAIGFRCASSL